MTSSTDIGVNVGTLPKVKLAVSSRRVSDEARILRYQTTAAKCVRGSGTVFTDLGFANPARERLKARLILQIYKLIKERGLTLAEAGKMIGNKATSGFRAHARAVRVLFRQAPDGTF